MIAFIRNSWLGRFLVAPLIGAATALLIAGMYIALR